MEGLLHFMKNKERNFHRMGMRATHADLKNYFIEYIDIPSSQICNLNFTKILQNWSIYYYLYYYGNEKSSTNQYVGHWS